MLFRARDFKDAKGVPADRDPSETLGARDVSLPPEQAFPHLFPHPEASAVAPSGRASEPLKCTVPRSNVDAEMTVADRLADALQLAARAGEWDVVAQLGRQLAALEQTIGERPLRVVK